MIERALPPDDRPADPARSDPGESVPSARRLRLGEAGDDDGDELVDGPSGEADGVDAVPSGAGDAAADATADDVAAEDASEPAGSPRGDGSDCPRPLGARIEALLFASGRVLTLARIGKALNVETPIVQAALTALVASWRERAGAVELVEVGGGYRFLTRPDFHEDLASLRPAQGPERLSPAALETLAVVAYRQPITRADVEAVRGVQAGPLLRLLQERDLIRITGRSSEPGHPLLYGTTKRFLDHFGLKSLKALPDLKDVLESA
jgi:segregation and condensation protein B